jgi:hypothetical protein
VVNTMLRAMTCRTWIVVGVWLRILAEARHLVNDLLHPLPRPRQRLVRPVPEGKVILSDMKATSDHLRRMMRMKKPSSSFTLTHIRMTRVVSWCSDVSA